MSNHYDAIVIGCGGVGSAALYELARRGLHVLGIDQFSPPHDLGSTHGQTRIIRQAYFEHADYVPLLLRAYEHWHEIEAAAKLPLFAQVGLLEVGPRNGIVVPGVLASASQHGLAVEELTAAETERRFPGFRVPHGYAAVFEPAAGFLRVEVCVAALLNLAAQAAGEVLPNTTVVGWLPQGASYVVTTDRGAFSAERLIITTGAWTARVLPLLGVSLEVRRKQIYWFDVAHAKRDNYHADAGAPTFLYELPHGVFYGFPQFDKRGVKVAQHSGGVHVADPTYIDRSLDPVEHDAVCQFIADHMPGVIPQHREHATCMYTMSPDEHFIVDTLPDHPGVVFAAGLSGHGYKFAPVLGEILADLAEHGQTRHPIDFLRANRFAGPLSPPGLP